MIFRSCDVATWWILPDRSGPDRGIRRGRVVRGLRQALAIAGAVRVQTCHLDVCPGASYHRRKGARS